MKNVFETMNALEDEVGEWTVPVMLLLMFCGVGSFLAWLLGTLAAEIGIARGGCLVFLGSAVACGCLLLALCFCLRRNAREDRLVAQMRQEIREELSKSN